MKHTILLFVALLLFQPSHAEGKAKVFILSGQSNMSGGGDVVEGGLGFDAAVGDKVRIWDACGEWGKRGIPGKWKNPRILPLYQTHLRGHFFLPQPPRQRLASSLCEKFIPDSPK